MTDTSKPANPEPGLSALGPLARVIADKVSTVPVRHCLGGTDDLVNELTLAVAVYVGRHVLPVEGPAVAPSAPPARAAEWRAAAEHIEAMRGYPSLMVPEEAVAELRRVADEDAQPVSPLSILGVGAQGEDAQREARRTVLRLLLGRADRNALAPDEAALLRHHVEAETREGDTARAVAAGNLRHVQLIVPELDQLRGHLRYVLDYRGPGHAHLAEGRWDRDGSPCAHCARLVAARAALDGTEQPPHNPEA